MDVKMWFTSLGILCSLRTSSGNYEKYHVVVALTNLGQAMLPSLKSTTGFVQITMGGEDAVRMMEILHAYIIVPMHFESWTR